MGERREQEAGAVTVRDHAPAAAIDALAGAGA